jgi:hypothetical protein
MNDYPCTKCGARHSESRLDLDGLCPPCLDPRPRTKVFADANPDRCSCAVCGKALAGRANRHTCSPRCRVALHRSRKRV